MPKPLRAAIQYAGAGGRDTGRGVKENICCLRERLDRCSFSLGKRQGRREKFSAAFTAFHNWGHFIPRNLEMPPTLGHFLERLAQNLEHFASLFFSSFDALLETLLPYFPWSVPPLRDHSFPDPSPQPWYRSVPQCSGLCCLVFSLTHSGLHPLSSLSCPPGHFYPVWGLLKHESQTRLSRPEFYVFVNDTISQQGYTWSAYISAAACWVPQNPSFCLLDPSSPFFSILTADKLVQILLGVFLFHFLPRILTSVSTLYPCSSDSSFFRFL